MEADDQGRQGEAVAQGVVVIVPRGDWQPKTPDDRHPQWQVFALPERQIPGFLRAYNAAALAAGIKRWAVRLEDGLADESAARFDGSV